jgi:CheY-like chemotaxis protein
MSLFKKKTTVANPDTALARELDVLDAVLANYPHGHLLPFGSPTRCPGCGTFGFVKSVNHGEGITHNTCMGCHLDWDITLRAIKAHRMSNGSKLVTPAGTLWSSADERGDATGVIDLTAPNNEGPNRIVRTDPLQLLLVEDNPNDAAMVEAILRPMIPHAVQIAHASTRHEGENAAKLGFDVVMLDLDLPESSGMQTLRSFRDECPDPPLCVCSGRDDIGVAWQGLAQQSLAKGELPRLARNVAEGSRELLGLLHLTTTG